VIWELTEAHPVVDLSLFAQRNFTVGTLAISLGYLLFFGNVVILPLWLQTQMGYTATWAGLAASPLGLLAVVLAPIVGRNLHRIDLRVLATMSFVTFAVVSFWSASVNTDVEFWQLAAPRLAQGIGVALFFTPLNAMLLSGLPAERVASASGLANFLRILAGSFGVSLVTTLWDRREALHHTQLVEHVTAFDPIGAEAVGRAHALGLHGDAAYALLAHTVTNQSFMLSINDVFWGAGMIFLGLVALVWLARPPFAATAGAGAH
jgi:MFS transporter, DHA2 family, multidrug resistance protein